MTVTHLQLAQGITKIARDANPTCMISHQRGNIKDETIENHLTATES